MKITRSFKYILVILWMILIFFFSNNNGISSTKQSDSFIIKPITFINNIVHLDMDQEEINRIIEIVEVPIRKCAHIFLYFVLAILVASLLKTYNFSYQEIFIYSFLICLLYSISDEIHQLFIAGRSGNLIDVVIDSLGIYLGIFIKHK